MFICRRHSRRRECGASTVEWGAAFLLISAIVVVLVASDLPTQIGERAEEAICRVSQGENCGEGAGAGDGGNAGSGGDEQENPGPDGGDGNGGDEGGGDDGGGGGGLWDTFTGAVGSVGDFASGATSWAIPSGGWNPTSALGNIGDFFGEAGNRFSNLSQYLTQSMQRRWDNPGQTVRDCLSGTCLVEDVSAFEAILVEGGELYNGGPYCGSHATCILGVQAGYEAMTTGHTVRFSDSRPPSDSLTAHEMQHVCDIEGIGSVGFYTTYAGDYLANRARGQDHETAYENIRWERRAYDVGDNYPAKRPSC
jgi:hypothetical protein